MTNHVDRFFAAVTVLAGDGPVKQRLIRAYTDNLADIDEDELPVALKERFAEARRRMHSVAPLNGEGPIRASVRKMSTKEASECAVALVQLYGELARLTALPGRHGSDDGVPAPFLVKSLPL